MAGLGKSIAELRDRRQRFEQLLALARRGVGKPAVVPLQEVIAFGSNPGNLRMRLYVPERLLRAPSLIVALHGCGQTVEEYARGTGWPTFADRHGSIVVFPEQRPHNNASQCFSWFLSTCALGDRVRAASKHRGPWPKISVWHGTADPIVRPCNGEDVIRQWTDLHGLPTHPSREERIAGHIRRLWLGADGNPRIEAFSLTGMAHAEPLGLSTEADAYGAVGPFFVDVGICSTQRIAHFWGLGRERASARPAAADATGASVQIAATAGDADRVDATAAIAAAFKAAGLPLPQATGSATASIIAAALEAAGLRK